MYADRKEMDDIFVCLVPAAFFYSKYIHNFSDTIICMNEKIFEFPPPDLSPQVLEKSQITALAEKLRPQGAGEKVKKHLEILAGMTESIREDGFELLIEDEINTEGTVVRIEIS